MSAGWDCNTCWRMAASATSLSRIVQPHLKAKRLNLIGNAPEFSMPAYVVYPLDCDRDLFGIALEIMHRIAHSKAIIKVGNKPVRHSRKAREFSAEYKQRGQ
jgi:hypothetical protein